MKPEQVPRSIYIEEALGRYGFHVMTGTCNFQSKPLWHWHTGVEIALFHAGVADVFSRTWRTSLLPGDSVIAPSQVDHGSQGVFSRTVLHFVPDLVPQQYSSFIQRILDSPDGTHFTPEPDAAERFVWVAQQLSQTGSGPIPLPTIQALVGLALADVQANLEEPRVDTLPYQVRAMIAHMHANPESDETIDHVIQQFGFSRSRVFDLFTQHVSCSPGAYWDRIRLEHARKLLRQGYRVGDVANQVGFVTLRGFQRLSRGIMA